MRCRSLPVLALLAIAGAGAGAPAASASPVPISGLRWVVAFSYAKGQFADVLGQDCVSLTTVEWRSGRSRDKSMFLLGTPGYIASGTYDPIARRGAANESVAALRFERLAAQGGRAFELRGMGMEIAGTRAYVTGRVVNVKSTIAAAKRVRLAVIAAPKFSQAPRMTSSSG